MKCIFYFHLSRKLNKYYGSGRKRCSDRRLELLIPAFLGNYDKQAYDARTDQPTDELTDGYKGSKENKVSKVHKTYGCLTSCHRKHSE